MLTSEKVENDGAYKEFEETCEIQYINPILKFNGSSGVLTFLWDSLGHSIIGASNDAHSDQSNKYLC